MAMAMQFMMSRMEQAQEETRVRMTEELLSYKEYKVPIFLKTSDRVLWANKFDLAKKSGYFRKLFRSNDYRESNGAVDLPETDEHPFRRFLVERVLRGLKYGAAAMDFTGLSLKYKLELLRMVKLLKIKEFVKILEVDLFSSVMMNVSFISSETVTNIDLILSTTLELGLGEVSEEISNIVGIHLGDIVEIIEEEDIDLSDPVVIALASTGTGGAEEIDKFRLINHFKDTTSAENDIPEIDLNSIE